MAIRRRKTIPLLIVAGSLVLAVGIYFGLLDSAFVRVMAEWTAHWTSASLNLLGASTRVDGTIVASESFAVDIVAECTGIGPMVVFAGAVLAYPSRWRSKGLGALLGVVALAAINLVRITSLFWLGATFPQYLDFAHMLVWQAAIIVLSIALWLFWAERCGNARNA